MSKCSTLDVAAPHASMTTVLQQWSIFFLLLAARGLKMPRPDRWTLAGGGRGEQAATPTSKSAASIEMNEVPSGAWGSAASFRRCNEQLRLLVLDELHSLRRLAD